MGLPVEVNNLMLGSLGGYTVGRSLRFRSSASAYLNRTPASASNQTTWTWSGWVKKGNYSSYGCMFGAYTGAGATYTVLQWQNDNTLVFYNQTSSSITMNLNTTQVFRDPSAWYHVVAVYDSTQATASNRGKIYINGVQVTAFSTATYPSLNANATINSVVPHDLGRFGGALNYFDGYLAEVNFIDGQALTPSSFGAYDTNGVWQPKKYTGTYGTNGFYLPFSSGFNTTQTYAGSFNGSSQFLSVASSASLSPGTGDFTVEANVYFNATPSSGSYAPIFENQIATTAATSDKFYLAVKNNSGTLRLEMGQHSTANVAYVNWTPSINTWYHVALVRQSGTTLLFINGVQQTVTNSTVFNGTSFGQNGASFGAVSTPLYLNGYLSNARYVVGSAVYTTGFTPPSANLTAVTNTQWLTLQNSTIIDNSTAARTITNNGSLSVSLQYPFQYTLASVGSDYSGNSNNWTLNNINYTILGTTYDSMIDSPTVSASSSNYAVLNPVGVPYNTGTAAGGNLNWTGATTADKGMAATISMDSGKWYWECTVTATAAGSNSYVGIVKTAGTADSNANRVYYRGDGATVKYGTATTGLTSYTTNDVIGVAYDYSAQTLAFYKNNTLVTTVTGINLEPNLPWVGGYTTTESWSVNFGQRPFTYTPPSGFKALNTYNLPAPSIANGAQYFAATTYTGTGATQSISNGSNNTIGTTFQPDLIWGKQRNGASSNVLTDSVRGTNSQLSSNLTNAQDTQTDVVTAFNSNGFTVGASAGFNMNQSGSTLVAWQWKAGGTGVTNTSGTITSTVSANPSAGFSIVTFTGNGTNGATVGHGLGIAPSMVIIKSRSGVRNWQVYHTSIGNTGAVYLNTTGATVTASTNWNNTSPTSSVVSLGTDGNVNANTETYVAYCFAAVRGYSAFGKYTGNGSADGPFVFTNFRPRWLLIKNSSNGTVYWNLIDTSRSPYNVADKYLCPNASDAEATYGGWDILSNGFKIRNTGGSLNNNGDTYIYAAFAENPFSIARAR